jgi:hypothetical protein
MLDDGMFCNDDLLFFGYESRRQSAVASASVLFQYCDDFLSHPERYPTANDFSRSPSFQYEQIVFIAHSLGAPVLRQMVLKAIDEGRPWVHKTSLVFFAPATQGARAEAAIQSLTAWRPAGIAALANIYYRFKWPVVADLKVGSPFLKNLYEGTFRRLSEGYLFLNSRQTYFAAEENIIEVGQPELAFDKPSYYFVGRDHNSVCKPRNVTDPVYDRFTRLIDGLR